MGQECFGIMYGCEYDFRVAQGDSPENDAAFEAIYDAANYYDGPVPAATEHRGGTELIGLWVAVGGSGVKGAAPFHTAAIPFTERQVEAEFPEQVKAAKKAWPAFAAHVEVKTGLKLGEPRLWLTTTETA